MIDVFLTPQAVPFSIALCVVAGLFILEIISLLLGSSLLAIGSDAPDVDLDLDADFDIDLDADVDFEPDLDAAQTADMAPSGLFGWLGLKDVPFMIWFVTFLTVFGLTGLVLLSLSAGLGFGLPLFVTVPAGFVSAVWWTRFVSAIVAAIMPKTESTAMSVRHLGGHHGTITQGTARRGHPAEAKIKDRHGNIHYLRVEPLDDDAEIPQGTDVHVMRKRNGTLFVMAIN